MSNFPFFSSGWIFAWHQGNVINQRVCVRDKWTNTCLWVSVSLWVLMSACVFLPNPLSHRHSLSHSLSLNLYVWISFLSCEERTFCIFHPVVIPEQSFLMFWPEVLLYCMYFFSFISWVLALCVSVVAREFAWIWGKISSLLLNILQCGSAALASWTENYIIAVWHSKWYWAHESACVHATFVHTDSEKLSVEHWQKWEDKEHK